MEVKVRFVSSRMLWELSVGRIIFEFDHDTPLWVMERAIVAGLWGAA